jgi:hypothetical protein
MVIFSSENGGDTFLRKVCNNLQSAATTQKAINNIFTAVRISNLW